MRGVILRSFPAILKFTHSGHCPGLLGTPAMIGVRTFGLASTPGETYLGGVLLVAI